MRTKSSIVTLLLITSLLLAPASLAAPTGPVDFGWFSQVKAFFVDVFDFFRFDTPTQPEDLGERGTLKTQTQYVCDPDEMGGMGDPGGC